MNYHNTSLMDPQDCLICRITFGFLTAPLIFLTMAGTIIAF